MDFCHYFVIGRGELQVTEKAIPLLIEFDHHLSLLLSPPVCNHSARAYSDGLWE